MSNLNNLLGMVYFHLEKAGESKILENFSIRGQDREWEADKNINLISGKNTMKKVLDELEKSKLVKVDLDNKVLKIL